MEQSPEKTFGMSRGLITGLLITIVVLFLLSLGFQWYIYSQIPASMPSAMMDEDDQEDMEDIMDEMMEDESVMEDEGSTIEQVGTLLPDDAEVVQVYVLSNSIALVSTLAQGENPHIDRSLTLWRVNTEGDTATELDEISASGAGVSYGFRESVLGAYFHELIFSWEGSYTEERHFFNENGELIAHTTAHRGHTVEVEKDGRTITIALSPDDPCQPAALGGEATLNGVTVDGSLKGIDSPVRISCVTGYGGGYGWVEDLPSVTLQGNNLGFAFPNNVGYVQVLLDGPLNYDSVSLR